MIPDSLWTIDSFGRTNGYPFVVEGSFSQGTAPCAYTPLNLHRRHWRVRRYHKRGGCGILQLWETHPKEYYRIGTVDPSAGGYFSCRLSCACSGGMH